MTMNDGNVPEELKLECEITGAHLTLNGLITLSASANRGDFSTVHEPLREAIWGSVEDDVEVGMRAILSIDDETGRTLLEINPGFESDSKETFLRLEVQYPEPYAHVPGEMNFSHAQLAGLWRRGEANIRAEEHRLAALAAADPADHSKAEKAKTLELVRTALAYVAGDQPEKSPVAVFEEWLALTGRRGDLTIVKCLPLAA